MVHGDLVLDDRPVTLDRPAEPGRGLVRLDLEVLVEIGETDFAVELHVGRVGALVISFIDELVAGTGSERGPKVQVLERVLLEVGAGEEVGPLAGEKIELDGPAGVSDGELAIALAVHIPADQSEPQLLAVGDELAQGTKVLELGVS